MTGCYILFSEKLNRFYVGITHEGIIERIKKHNEQAYGNHRYTAKANDWKEYLFIETNDLRQAIRIEKNIKKMKSSVYINNLKKYPVLVEKLKL